MKRAVSLVGSASDDLDDDAWRAIVKKSFATVGAKGAAIEKLQYTGWIGCEYKPRRDTDSGLSWMDRMGLR